MAEKRTEVIKHRVLNEVTGEEEIVEKEFVYNESPDRKVKYITHDLLRVMGQDAMAGSTFKTDLSGREESYEYEDENGYTFPIIAWEGILVDKGDYEVTFTRPDGSTFNVVVLF